MNAAHVAPPMIRGRYVNRAGGIPPHALKPERRRAVTPPGYRTPPPIEGENALHGYPPGPPYGGGGITAYSKVNVPGIVPGGLSGAAVAATVGP